MLTYSNFSSNYSYLTILICVCHLSSKIVEYDEYIDIYEYVIMIRHEEYIYIFTYEFVVVRKHDEKCLYIVDENVL